jgi:alpha-mannosidase
VPVAIQLPDAASRPAVFDQTGRELNSQLLDEDKLTHTYHMLVRVHDVPALGYEVLHTGVSKPSKTVSEAAMPLNVSQNESAISLWNSRVRIDIDKRTGCIVRLAQATSAGRASYQAPNSCANELQAFADNPKNYDAWNVDYGTFDHPMPIETVDSISVVTDGPLRKTVRIQRHWQNSHITQDISLDAGADEVVVDNTVDWHEKHVLLKAAFPLAASGPKATFEIPFGTIERPTTRNNSFEKAKFEVPAQRWADLGDAKQGVSIINDSKYGYDALGNVLRLTLLRSPTWPDPDADQGVQHFRYAIYPHAGTWREAQTMQRGYEFNQPLVATQVFAHAGELPPAHSFVSLESSNATPNVVLTAVKKAEDADGLIFRMYEYAGQAATVTLHVPPGATAATETNLMETPLGAALPLAGNAVTVAIKPYEILTIEVSYPSRVESASR